MIPKIKTKKEYHELFDVALSEKLPILYFDLKKGRLIFNFCTTQCFLSERHLVDLINLFTNSSPDFSYTLGVKDGCFTVPESVVDDLSDEIENILLNKDHFQLIDFYNVPFDLLLKPPSALENKALLPSTAEMNRRIEADQVATPAGDEMQYEGAGKDMKPYLSIKRYRGNKGVLAYDMLPSGYILNGKSQKRVTNIFYNLQRENPSTGKYNEILITDMAGHSGKHDLSFVREASKRLKEVVMDQGNWVYVSPGRPKTTQQIKGGIE